MESDIEWSARHLIEHVSLKYRNNDMKEVNICNGEKVRECKKIASKFNKTAMPLSWVMPKRLAQVFFLIQFLKLKKRIFLSLFFYQDKLSRIKFPLKRKSKPSFNSKLINMDVKI